MKSLTARHSRAIELLVGGMSGQDAAKEVGVTPGQMSKWRQQGMFQDAYAEEDRKVKEAARAATATTFADLHNVVIEGIKRDLADEETPASVRAQLYRLVLGKTLPDLATLKVEAKVETSTAEDNAEALARRLHGEE